MTVSKHPSYTNLFLASNSAAQLLLFSIPSGDAADTDEVEGGHERDINTQSPLRSPPIPSGEPSTSLPRLASPPAVLTMSRASGRPLLLEVLHQSEPIGTPTCLRGLRNFLPCLSGCGTAT